MYQDKWDSLLEKGASIEKRNGNWKIKVVKFIDHDYDNPKERWINLTDEVYQKFL